MYGLNVFVSPNAQLEKAGINGDVYATINTTYTKTNKHTGLSIFFAPSPNDVRNSWNLNFDINATTADKTINMLTKAVISNLPNSTAPEPKI